MAKHIFKYADQAAYDADTSRPAGDNVASSIGAAAQFDGVNVVIDFDSPGKKIGDSAFFDTVLHKRVVIVGTTLNMSVLDTNRYKNLNSTFIGHIYGKDVFVDDRQLASEKYATGDEWLLSGFDLTQAGSAEVTFKYYSASGDYVKNLTLSWDAGADIASIRSQISSAAGIKDYCVPFAIDDTSFGVTVNGYNSGMGLTLVSGDITVERTHQGYQAQYYPNLPYSTQVIQHCGTVTYYGWLHYEMFYDYYYNSGAASKTALGGDPLKFSAFNDTDNPTLYEAYNGDYVAYMKAEYEYGKVEYPTSKYSMQDFAFGDNYDNSKTLALASHERSDGQTIFDFPNAHSAHLQGTTIAGETTGFEPGTGHLGGQAEAYLLYTQTLKDKSDPINVAIGKKGGTQVAYNTTTRLAFQSYSTYAWFFFGYGGTLNFNLRFNAFAAHVFRAF